MVECTLSFTHCLRLNLQLHTIDLVRTCRISSFCTVAWQLARFQLTRCIARFLGDSLASCISWSYRCNGLVFASILHTRTHTHTHPFNSPFFGTTQVSQYRKGKTNLDFCEARDSEWQWHQLGHMQVCTLLQTDNHPAPHYSFFLQAGCPSCHPTNSVKHWRQICQYFEVLKCTRHYKHSRPTFCVFAYIHIWSTDFKEQNFKAGSITNQLVSH